MKNTTLLFLFSILYFKLSFAQTVDFNNYTPLRSKGTVPEDFLLLSSEKYEAGREQINEDESRRVRKSQDQFYLESSYLINKLLFSGNVLFGDTVTNYLNRIKNNVLKSEPALRDNIRVYLLRSEEVNAFTDNNGIIVVTTGLMARVQNEAQLAFILSHESIHYKEKHALNSYVEEDKMLSGKGIYKNLRRSEIELSRFQYSKDLESEADKKGFEIFKKSGYDIHQAIDALSILSYADHPAFDLEFPKDYFNSARYGIPGAYFPDTIPPLVIDENYDDSKSTHPNITKRKTDISAAIKNSSSNDSSLFILGEAAFNYVRKICRYELCELYINHLKYEEAIYQVYALQSEENTVYLEKSLAKALYGLSIYRTSDNRRSSDKNSEDVEGNSRAVYYFAEVIPSKELNVLALKYAWELHLKDPDNRYLKNICRHLTYTLIDKNETQLSSFKTPRQIMMDSVKLAETKSDTLPVETSTHKIAASKVKNAYWAYAFTDFLNDSSFVQMFEEAADWKNELKNTETEDEEKASLAMGAEKILVVNPFYIVYDGRKGEGIEIIESESALINLHNQVNTCTEKLGMESNYLDPNFLNANDAEKINDMAILSAWLSEKISHDENKTEIINAQSEYYQEVTASYQADHVIWLGYLNYFDPIHNLGQKILFSFFTGIALPFLTYDLIRTHYITTVYILAADGKKGYSSIEYYKTSKTNDSDSFIKSQLYYLFHEMQKPVEK